MAESLVARGTTTSPGNTTAIDVASTNHACIGSFDTMECSTDVFVHRRGGVRLTDDGTPHPFPPQPPCANHAIVVTDASPTVFANDLAVACLGHNYNGSENISTVNQNNVFADS